MYLYIKVTMWPRKHGINTLDFRIKTINLLQDEKEKMIQKNSILPVQGEVPLLFLLLNTITRY